MAYSDNPNEDFTPPAPTYTGGSAIMSAVDQQGNEWQFDNDKEKWVNLSTGEGLAPRDFASKASGSRNAADNTKFLADQMRQEESQLTAPLLPRQPVVPPHSLIQPPPIAPIHYSPKQIAAVQDQEPEASTAVPPTAEAWNTAIAGNPAGAATFFKARALADTYDYNQRLQRLVSGGMDYNQALSKIGPPPFTKGAPTQSATPFQFHQGGAFNRTTGEWNPLPGIKAPPPKLTDVEKASLNSSLRETESDELNARKDLNAARKAMAGATDAETMDSETAKANAALSAIAKARARRQKVIQGFGNTVTPSPTPIAPARQPVSAPSALSQPNGLRVRVKSKDGKIGTIPQDQLSKALAEGYTQM